jgi:FG-GAP-like repeat
MRAFYVASFGLLAILKVGVSGADEIPEGLTNLPVRSAEPQVENSSQSENYDEKIYTWSILECDVSWKEYCNGEIYFDVDEAQRQFGRPFQICSWSYELHHDGGYHREFNQGPSLRFDGHPDYPNRVKSVRTWIYATGNGRDLGARVTLRNIRLRLIKFDIPDSLREQIGCNLLEARARPPVTTMLTADFDNEGASDLFFYWKLTPPPLTHGMFDGFNHIILGRTDGSFSDPIANTIARQAINEGPAHVVAGDFDGNDRTDLFVHWIRPADPVRDGENRTFLSTDTGKFIREPSYAIGPPSGPTSGWPATNEGPTNVVAGDFNGDRRTDLFFLWQRPLEPARDGENRTFLSTDTGKFVREPSYAIGPPSGPTSGWPATNESPTNVVAGDFNGDRRTDLFFLWERLRDPARNGENRTFLSTDAGKFVRESKYAIGLELVDEGPALVVADDFNRDGRADLYFLWNRPGQPRDRENRLFLSQEGGGFNHVIANPISPNPP